MTDEQFKQLMDILGEVGGAAYEAALRQVQVNAWIDIGLMVIALLIFMACVWVFSHANHVTDVDLSIVVVGGAMMLLALLAALAAIKDFASPHWQAIVLMAKLVAGR